MLRRVVALRSQLPVGTGFNGMGPPRVAGVSPGASDGPSHEHIKVPEHETNVGKFEVRPPHLAAHGAVEYSNYKRDKPGETQDITKLAYGKMPYEDHHPHYDYTNRTGHKEGFIRGNVEHIDHKLAIRTLYRSCIRCIPIVKHYYLLNLSMEKMKERIRRKFYQNKHVRDPDAKRTLLLIGWRDFHDSIGFRKTKGGMMKMFHDREDPQEMIDHYTNEEGKLIEERAYAAGERTGTGGPYDGHWSWSGKGIAWYHDMIKGRTHRGVTTSKGYFYPYKADGTNPWERNMDYEGWWQKNADPDKVSARKELAGWVAQGYVTPKHYASKNRRTYRHMVQNMEDVMKKPFHELYAKSRETIFQTSIREDCPEGNRIYAEKKLAFMDDETFTTKYEEFQPRIRQALREFPNPKAWKTDAFYLRCRQLLVPLEFNWAKAPIGVALENGFNEWISNDVNYAVYNSEQLAVIRANRKLNPMATTWAQFYTDFDPDVPDSRRLPWYHADFNYDRRFKWDERLWRMKKWVRSGDIDFVRPYFTALIYEWEQMVNRIEIIRQVGAVEKRYVAPRFVQLYRSLDKRNTIALSNQMKRFAGLSDNATAEQVAKALKSTKWDDFRFQVPVIIYPDGYIQPKLNLDGTPLEGELPPVQPSLTAASATASN